MRLAGGVAATLALPVAVMASVATDAFDRFDRFITSLDNVRLSFRQITEDDDGNVLEEVEGDLWFSSPGRFRLSFDSPDYPLIVSDGETVWLFESDIQQAVRRPYDTVEENGLLTVLTGGLDTLRSRYVLSTGVGDGRLLWLNANAIEETETMKRIALGFAGGVEGELSEVRLVDSFGGRIRMVITERSGFDADQSLFQFQAPENVTIIESQE